MQNGLTPRSRRLFGAHAENTSCSRPRAANVANFNLPAVDFEIEDEVETSMFLLIFKITIST